MTPKRKDTEHLSQQAASATECTGILPNPVDGLESAAVDELMSIYIDKPVHSCVSEASRVEDPARSPRPDAGAHPCDAHNPPKTTPASRPAR